MTTNHGEMRETYPDVGQAYRYRMETAEGSLTFQIDGDAADVSQSAVTLAIESSQTGEGLCRDVAGRNHHFAWAWVGAELHLWLDGALHVFQRAETRRRGRAAGAESSEDVLAPMPGAVLEVLVTEGDRVERNQTVVLMESMKMELVIAASRSGVVRRVAVEAGQQVDRGMRLLELAPEGDGGD